MCDYSLTAVKSRAAALEDKLVVHDFGTGTKGFAVEGDCGTAVCVKPGTEIAFEAPIQLGSMWYNTEPVQPSEHRVAIFRQVDKEIERSHHDALELPNGEVIKLTTLAVGQKAKVLQLPAAPKNEAEEKEQERVAWVG